MYSKYKPHGFQVFRALFEKAVRRLAFPVRPEAQYPDLVTGGYQNIFYAHHAFLFFKGVLIFFHLGHLSKKVQDWDLAHFFEELTTMTM